MGAKEKKALKRKHKKLIATRSSKEKTAADFLPLEGGRGSKHERSEPGEQRNTATVLYIGRIPHGFYEKEMKGYFSQFGNVKRLRISRNKKTGKSKHYGFIEFESPEVAAVVADCMHNYLLMEHLLQVHLVPQERVHPRLWRGFNYKYKPVDRVAVERRLLSRERTLEEHKKLVDKILRRDKKRRMLIEEAGIDYECPKIVGNLDPAPMKIKFDND